MNQVIDCNGTAFITPFLAKLYNAMGRTLDLAIKDASTDELTIANGIIDGKECIFYYNVPIEMLHCLNYGKVVAIDITNDHLYTLQELKGILYD